MIKIAADCGGGCFSFHLEDKYRDRYTMIMHALIKEAAYMALGHKVDLERVRAHQLKQLEGQKVSIWAEPRSKDSVSADGCLPGLFNLTENRTERIGMGAMNRPWSS
jgi:hypothetical protein